MIATVFDRDALISTLKAAIAPCNLVQIYSGEGVMILPGNHPLTKDQVRRRIGRWIPPGDFASIDTLIETRNLFKIDREWTKPRSRTGTPMNAARSGQETIAHKVWTCMVHLTKGVQPVSSKKIMEYTCSLHEITKSSAIDVLSRGKNMEYWSCPKYGYYLPGKEPSFSPNWSKRKQKTPRREAQLGTILRNLRAEPGGLHLSEIAIRTDINRKRCWKLLQDLHETGKLDKFRTDRKEPFTWILKK